MILYLMRHGIAEEFKLGSPDAGRALTQRGTLRTAMVARALDRLELRFDTIITSPYRRARQTAEIVARTTGFEGELVEDNRLTPSVRPEETVGIITELGVVEHVLFTGHEPNMSGTISHLVADGALSIDLRKASVAAIQIDRMTADPRGTLLWYLTPRVIEAIGQ